MENQQHSGSSDQIEFPDQRKYAETIGKASDSQPTKTKVAAFKSRIFKLVRLYTEQVSNLNPLLDSLNQEVFSREPQKMNQIVLLLLNKQPNMDKNYLVKLLEIYKTMILFKSKSEENNAIHQTFVRMLKKVLNENGDKIISEMMQKVFTKRNSKLNVTFFQYLARKIPASKKIIVSQCKRLQQSPKLRPAQIKQLKKLQSKVMKQKAEVVKKQETH